MSYLFPKEEVIIKLKQLNPWWETHNLSNHFTQWKPREYLKLLYPLVILRTIKRAIIIMGMRRVGKTVLIHHCIKKLLDIQLVSARHICYVNIEIPFFRGIHLEEFLRLFLKLKGIQDDDDIYIFFDEIQYLPDWELHLKSLVDIYHNVKFVVSGSAAAALKLQSKESGAGRFTEFHLPPLSFYEYLELTNNQFLIQKHPKPNNKSNNSIQYFSNDIFKLNEKFIEYINFGGYPELSLSQEMRNDPARYVRSDIIDKVLLRDLPSLYGIRNIQELNSLFTYLAYNSGNEFSIDGISTNSGVAKNTIKKYLDYLEAAFLIRIIHKLDQNAKKFIRATRFKVYLTNPTLRSALFKPLSTGDSELGLMVETAIYSQWFHSNEERRLYYANWKFGEIDLVYLGDDMKPWWCLEVKWSDRIHSNINELKNIHNFCKRHHLNSTLVTTVSIHDIKEYDKINYEFVPASIYCYMVGKHLIENKKPHYES